MQQILRNLEHLRKLSGNVQISFLNNVKNDLLKEILAYTYDTHKKYKIEEGKFNKFYTGRCGDQSLNEGTWNMFTYCFLDHLADIKSAKDEDIKELTEWLSSFDLQSQEFFKMVLFKDLRLNMNIKKFQKVWPDFLVQPQVQLAQVFEGKSFNNPKYSRKLDGVRCYYLDGVAISRTNKNHHEEPLKHITEQLQNIPNINDYVLDGEIVYLNPDGSEDFKKAISLVRSEKRVDDCKNLYFVVFDYIKKDKFLSKQLDIPFEDAYTNLKQTLGCFDNNVWSYKTNLPNVIINKQVGEAGFEELEKAWRENHWEGLMLRNGSYPYEYKRTNNLLKIKNMQDLEVKLVSMEEGTGRHQGRLGAFITDYNGFPLKIGSGFSDEQREKYWNNKDFYINKFVKVKYFEKTTNAQGGESLRFPTFLCFRDPITMEEFI